MSKLLEGVGLARARRATTDGTHGLRHQAKVRARKSTIGWSVCRLPRDKDRGHQHAGCTWPILSGRSEVISETTRGAAELFHDREDIQLVANPADAKEVAGTIERLTSRLDEALLR